MTESSRFEPQQRAPDRVGGELASAGMPHVVSVGAVGAAAAGGAPHRQHGVHMRDAKDSEAAASSSAFRESASYSRQSVRSRRA